MWAAASSTICCTNHSSQLYISSLYLMRMWLVQLCRSIKKDVKKVLAPVLTPGYTTRNWTPYGPHLLITNLWNQWFMLTGNLPCCLFIVANYFVVYLSNPYILQFAYESVTGTYWQKSYESQDKQLLSSHPPSKSVSCRKLPGWSKIISPL